MSAQDRQAMIIDAVTPLLIEQGRSVTSRQIAEAAGIAEGTIWRAFGDKDSLIKAVVEKHLDPTEFRLDMASINPNTPLELKVKAIIVLLRGRFELSFRILSSLGPEYQPKPAGPEQFGLVIAKILAPDLANLNESAVDIGRLIRNLVLASSLPPINQGDPFDPDELTRLVLYGIAGAPKPTSAN
jgi:AcrR family transcriptional regulator